MTGVWMGLLALRKIPICLNYDSPTGETSHMSGMKQLLSDNCHNLVLTYDVALKATGLEVNLFTSCLVPASPRCLDRDSDRDRELKRHP